MVQNKNIFKLSKIEKFNQKLRFVLKNFEFYRCKASKSRLLDHDLVPAILVHARQLSRRSQHSRTE